MDDRNRFKKITVRFTTSEYNFYQKHKRLSKMSHADYILSLLPQKSKATDSLQSYYEDIIKEAEASGHVICRKQN